VSSRLWVAGLVVLATLGLACNGAANGPPSDFCVIYADNPHLSSTGLAKGRFEIIGKGWFKCTKSPREITVYVELQSKSGAHWITVGVPGTAQFKNPPAGKKSKEVPAVLPCTDGVFRTRARAHGVDDAGNDVESTEWSYSAEVRDPCKKT
jgi:hypothetical protein